MSLMPFSSRSSSRSSGGGDAGGEKKLSNRKYTISLSFSGLITSGIITIIAIGWIFAFGVIVGRGYNPEKKMPELARLLPPPEGQDAPKEAKGILKPEELTFMTDLKQTQPAANARPGQRLICKCRRAERIRMQPVARQVQLKLLCRRLDPKGRQRLIVPRAMPQCGNAQTEHDAPEGIAPGPAQWLK